jgi:hypothetical protein
MTTSTVLGLSLQLVFPLLDGRRNVKWTKLSSTVRTSHPYAARLGVTCFASSSVEMDLKLILKAETEGREGCNDVSPEKARTREA